MRIEAIDLLRGGVMLLMIVDHAREYANLAAVSDPVNITQVSPAIFFTRWISHFCAPVFVLLAGVSARLLIVKGRDRHVVAQQLWRRGLVLIAIEFTVHWFAWTFNWQWQLFYAQVIWVLGVGMILLAGLLYWPERFVAAWGALLVFGHNLLDGVRFAPDTAAQYLWSILHQKNVLPLGGGYAVRTTYPLIPLIGVMALGYCLGGLYQLEAAQRQRLLLQLGGATCGLFLLLRLFNLYGETNLFAVQPSATLTLMSLFNVTKYPTSLQFLLMTLGPSLCAMAWVERMKSNALNWVITIGRVPMFYYLAHLYALHALSLLLALLAGHPWATFDFKARITGMPATFGFPLWGVYVFAAVTVALLYPLCRRYDDWRRQSRSVIARYL